MRGACSATIQAKTAVRQKGEHSVTNEEIAAYYAYLQAYAAGKYGHSAEVEDLVQESMTDALLQIRRGAEIRYPKAFLCTILSRRYSDMLRARYSSRCEFFEDMTILGTPSEEDFTDPPPDPDAEEEEARRELGRLREIYREVVVRYYMYGHSVAQISAALKIPRGTVMSRLHQGRSLVREGITGMEKYTELSYAPKYVQLGIEGGTNDRHEPFSLLTSPIESNLLIIAYEKPLSLEEISAGLGIPCAYLEHFTDRLCQGELMGRTPGGLYYTRCFLQEYADQFGDIPAQQALAEELAHTVWEEILNTFSPMMAEEEVRAMSDKQRATLFLFLMMQTLNKCVHRAMTAGTDYDPEVLPERPGGCRWLASGKILTRDTKPHRYDRSGPAEISYSVKRNGTNDCMMFDCQSLFGDTHWVYGRRMPGMNLGRIMRLIASLLPCDVTPEDDQSYEAIPELEKLHILRRDANGQAVPDIPALSWDTVRRWDQASIDIRHRMYERIGPRLEAIVEKRHVRVPHHVDGWQRYTRAGALGCYTMAQMEAIAEAKLMPWQVKIGETPIIYLGYKKNI